MSNNNNEYNISKKLYYLEETKIHIMNSILNRGGDVSENDTFRSYADKIDNLPTMYVSNELPENANEGDYCLIIG